VKPIVVIPTYNERESIGSLLPEIMRTVPGIHVVVVDDSSPDGTGALVRRLARRYSGRVHLISRPAKLGLGSAYVAGFRFALKKGIYDPVIQMDADRSHDPRMLPKMIKQIACYDAVVGSRYHGGIRVINWSWRRLLLSVFANWYARLVTRLPLTDLTGGYNAWRRDLLSRIGMGALRCNGYAFQIELKHHCHRLGGRAIEIPIIFTGRMEGKSKLSRSVVLEATLSVWRMRFAPYHRRWATNRNSGGGKGTGI
jgi:dolichol-phosphate mannosyltransferase